MGGREGPVEPWLQAVRGGGRVSLPGDGVTLRAGRGPEPVQVELSKQQQCSAWAAVCGHLELSYRVRPHPLFLVPTL